MISQAFLDNAKARSNTVENMLNSWLMNLQISLDKYTLIWALIYCGLRAYIESGQQADYIMYWFRQPLNPFAHFRY